MAEKYWISTPPQVCDLCSEAIEDVFIDGATWVGPWACMCPSCHRISGQGFGTGRGQEYQKVSAGWLKSRG